MLLFLSREKHVKQHALAQTPKRISSKLSTSFEGSPTTCHGQSLDLQLNTSSLSPLNLPSTVGQLRGPHQAPAMGMPCPSRQVVSC